MEDILEEYGEAILMGIGAVLVLGVVFVAVVANVPQFAQIFAKTLCG